MLFLSTHDLLEPEKCVETRVYPGFKLSKYLNLNPGPGKPGYRDKTLNVKNIYRKLSCNTFKSFQNHDNMFAVHFSIFSGTFWKYHMQCFINTYW